MTTAQALKAVKDLIEYLKTNPISEVKVDWYDSPLSGEGEMLKRAVKVEYFIQTVENIVSLNTLNSQLETIDSQISSLTAQKEELVSLGEQIKTIQ